MQRNKTFTRWVHKKGRFNYARTYSYLADQLHSIKKGVTLNLKSFAIRSAIALVFGPLILLAAFYGKIYWLGFVMLVVILSLSEFYEIAEKKGAFSKLLVGGITSIAIIFSLYSSGEFALVPTFILSLIIIFFCELYSTKGSPVLNASTTFFGTLYFSLLFGSFVLIRELPTRYGLDYGPAGKWIVMMILATWICDTAAYVFGSYFGKHKLIARISPNKTVEGTFAGFIFAILSAYVCHIWFIVGLRAVDSLVIGAIVS